VSQNIKINELLVGPKDPDAVLDYTLQWGNDIGALYLLLDTIATSTWIVPDALTITSQLHTLTTTTVWLAGGLDGSDYEITNRITTAGGRTDDRTFVLQVRDR